MTDERAKAHLWNVFYLTFDGGQSVDLMISHEEYMMLGKLCEVVKQGEKIEGVP